MAFKYTELVIDCQSDADNIYMNILLIHLVVSRNLFNFSK